MYARRPQISEQSYPSFRSSCGICSQTFYPLSVGFLPSNKIHTLTLYFFGNQPRTPRKKREPKLEGGKKKERETTRAKEAKRIERGKEKQRLSQVQVSGSNDLCTF
ncbi:hypothetical protein K1719_008954 [Acacia pycnantha]|nr:hypothetical protein K1719_008954 [Acacia pycnantha]